MWLKIVISVIAVIIIVGGVFLINRPRSMSDLVRTVVTENQQVAERLEEIRDHTVATLSPITYPLSPAVSSTVDLVVPFIAQAPTGNWDEAHQELCEEASLVMVKYFVTHEKLTPAKAEEEYVKLKEWQTEKFGSWLDTDAEQTARIAREFYALNVELVRGLDVTIERIERELAAGHPVIVPLYGKDLPNPNFRNVSDYHMIVLRGYDRDEFITNDNGTTRGARWKYPKENVWAAIHDYNAGNPHAGDKKILIVRGLLDVTK